MQRDSVMVEKVRTSPGLATLKACAAFGGPTGDLYGFCCWAAELLRAETGEPWGAGRVDYWLRRECWGSGWVQSGGTQLTVSGQARLRVLAGEMTEEEAEIWRAA